MNAALGILCLPSQCSGKVECMLMGMVYVAQDFLRHLQQELETNPDFKGSL